MIVPVGMYWTEISCDFEYLIDQISAGHKYVFSNLNKARIVAVLSKLGTGTAWNFSPTLPLRELLKFTGR